MQILPHAEVFSPIYEGEHLENLKKRIEEVEETGAIVATGKLEQLEKLQSDLEKAGYVKVDDGSLD